MQRPHRALLAAVALLLAPTFQPLPPPAPAQPAAFTLDGRRDPAYVLVAEDAPGDLAPELAIQDKFRWTDLTRLYLAYDSTNLYAYVDLPNYVQGAASGQIGLAIVLPDGDTTGTAADPLRPAHIAYAFGSTVAGQCPASPLAQTRHPNSVIRGEILGTGDGANSNSGYTFLATRVLGAWQGTGLNWGGISLSPIGDHIAYANAFGVEFSIPWFDLGLAGPEPLYLSFFTSAGGSSPGIFDTVPPDVQGSAVLTSTALTQLATLSLPLPLPQSVSLGCATSTAVESAGTAVITATLHSALTQTVAVSYTTTALTAGPSDFTPLTGIVTFTAGTTRQAINVPLNDDTATEAPETFLVTLSNPFRVTLTSPYTTTVTISDDDGAHTLYLPVMTR